MKNFEETESYKSIDEMLKAYRNGDDNLDEFPDSIEKQTLLSTIKNWQSKMSENKLSNDDLLDLKSKIDSAENEEEVVKIILNITDNYEITPEIREVLSEHKDLIRRIRKINNGQKDYFQKLI